MTETQALVAGAEVGIDDLPQFLSRRFADETVNEFIQLNYDEPKDERSRPKSRPIVGRGIKAKPSADEWCAPFTAQRQACGNKIKEYTVSVAEGFFSGEPYGTVKRAGYGPPLRNAPLSLPNAVSPRFGFSSGWLTSRPTTSEVKRRRQLAPSKARFPALQTVSSSQADDSVMEELNDYDKALSWTAQKVQARREIREPDFTNERPWIRGAPRPGLLQRKEDQLNDPDLPEQFQPSSHSPPSLPPSWKIAEPAAPPQSASFRGASPEILRLSPTPPTSPIAVPPSPTPRGSTRSHRPSVLQSRIDVADVAMVAGAVGGGNAASTLKKASVSIRMQQFHQVLTKNMSESPDAVQTAIQDARDGTFENRASPRESVMFAQQDGSTSRRGSAIWRLSHKVSKSIRMSRVNEFRRMNNEEGSGGNFRDRVNKSDRDIAQESFLRYFQSESGNHWDEEKIIEALADFGIKAANKTEKMALFSILKDFKATQSPMDEDVEVVIVGLKIFFNMIEEARQKLRNTRSASVFQAWKYVDTEDMGLLSPTDVMKLLEDLQLVSAENTIARAGVQAMVRECNKDAVTGLIPLNEVEYLVSSVREFQTRSRRLEERQVKANYTIKDNVFQEFRSQLISFHRCFQDLDEDRSGYLDFEEALNLLTQFGFMSKSMPPANKRKAQDLLDTYVVAADDGSWETRLTFVQFLNVVGNLRSMEMESKKDAVNTLFRAYDRNRHLDWDPATTPALSIKAVCCILYDMGIRPRSLAEQEAMAMLIEDADADGSGELDESELLFLVQRITERVQEMVRESQNKRGQELRFTQREVNKLRQAFEALDDEGDGTLGISEVERCIAMAGVTIPHAKAVRLIQEIDEDESGQLDFTEFMSLMRRIEDDFRHRNAEAQKQQQQLGSGGTDEKEDKETAAESRRGTVVPGKKAAPRRAVAQGQGAAGGVKKR